MNALDLEYQRLDALRIIRSCLLELKWLSAATRFELAMHRHYWALRHAYKAGFNPDQPRDEFGKWTDAEQAAPAGSGQRTSESGQSSQATANADGADTAARVYRTQFRPDERTVSSGELIQAGGQDIGSFGDGISVAKGPGISHEENFDPQTGVTKLSFTGIGRVVVDQKVGDVVTGTGYDVGTQARPDRGLTITIDRNGQVRDYRTVQA